MYGEDHLDSIISHYSSHFEESQVEFDAVACKDEWLELKLHYSRSGLQLPADQLWKDLFSNPQLCERFSNVLVIVELCLVMPVQTACCERGNSCLNRVMVDSRSSLNVSTVDALMFIALNGPSPESFNAAPCVGRMLLAGQREKRPETMD